MKKTKRMKKKTYLNQKADFFFILGGCFQINDK